MIFNDYYKAEKLTEVACRYDITYSTGSYDLFEALFINKRKFNVSGLSFNYVDRPHQWKGDEARKAEKAIAKGNVNVSSVFVPDLQKHNIGFGDVNGTHDALIIYFTPDYSVIELFIARGYINDIQALYSQVKDGDLNDEMQTLRESAKQIFKGKLPNQ